MFRPNFLLRLRPIGLALRASPARRGISEHEFQTELDLAVMRAGRCDSAAGVVVRAVLKDRLHVGLSEIRVIQNVEEFGPEGKSFILFEVEPFEQREIDIHQIRSNDGASPHITEEAWYWVSQPQRVWQRERIGVIPVLCGSQAYPVCSDTLRRVQASAWSEIGTVRGAGVPRTGKIKHQLRRQRLARHDQGSA